MTRFNYILPMLVGVLAFANFLWMMIIPFYGLAAFSFIVAVPSLAVAMVEHRKYQNYLKR